MKKTIVYLIAGLVVLAILIAAIGGSSEQPNNNEDNPSFATIQSDVQSGAHFVDVRTAEEFAAGYITGAENFPLISMQAGQFPEYAKDDKIYVYCRSGNRSAQAAQLLAGQGFSDVVDLGGLEDVQAIGGTLTQ